MRVVIGGSRVIDNQALLDDTMAKAAAAGIVPTVVLHGDCPDGVDQLANRWAKARGIKVETYPAPWKELGKIAGPLRNARMLAANVAAVVVLWNGTSRGAGNLLSGALKLRRKHPDLLLYVVQVETPPADRREPCARRDPVPRRPPAVRRQPTLFR